MATKTTTEIKKKITKKGDVVVVQETEITTVYAPGKDPEVKEVTRVEEFKGEEGYKRLPEDIRNQLEAQPGTNKGKGKDKVTPINKEATRGNFVNECLEEHNKLRKQHGAAPLKLNQELVKVAEGRAKDLAWKDEMTPRKDQTYGENISCLWSSDPEHSVQAEEVVSRWYSEGQNYKFDAEPKELSAGNQNTGHFTQMVWQNCKEFGVAAAKSDTNRIYVVAVYNPPGNFDGEFMKNVHPIGYKPKAGAAESTSEKQFSPADEFLHMNQEGVAAHNKYRSMHGVPNLVYSEKLARYAQEWADELTRKEKFEHRKQNEYGENLYFFKSTNPGAVASVEEACSSWYSEIEKYDYSNDPDVPQTGHFTQLVWKTTSEVGMGRAKSKKGMQVIVANYNPPGNLMGTFAANVPRPIKTKPNKY